jgi:hypothetical protein
MYHKEVTMRMEGDGPEGQPAESVETMTDLVALLDEGEEGGESALDEEEQGEGSDASEGEGEPEQEEDDEEQQDEPTIVLKHDGKEVALKQSEVVDLAQQGFDYTKKTMALAEERKSFEAVQGEVAQRRQEYEQLQTTYTQQLQTLAQVIQAELGTPPPIQLAQQDAAQYLAQKELHDRRKDKLHQVYAEIEAQERGSHQKRQDEFALKVQSTEKALRDTLPGWNDAKGQELIDYLATSGLNFDTLGHGIAEKGLFELANKAKAYDALLEKKAQMKPVSQLNKVTSPKAHNQPPQLARRQDAVKRYQAAPSIQTLADLL